MYGSVCFTLSVLLWALAQSGYSFQYCTAGVDGSSKLDLCFAANAVQPVSSDECDLYLSMSGYFRNGMGWAALGTGSLMDSSLMIVSYPNSNSSGT